jgi:hypothetical protein
MKTYRGRVVHLKHNNIQHVDNIINGPVSYLHVIRIELMIYAMVIKHHAHLVSRRHRNNNDYDFLVYSYALRIIMYILYVSERTTLF